MEIFEKVFLWSPESSAFSVARHESRFATDEAVGVSSFGFDESSIIMVEDSSGSTIRQNCQI